VLNSRLIGAEKLKAGASTVAFQVLDSFTGITGTREYERYATGVFF
jgi:hypothetical protein